MSHAPLTNFQAYANLWNDSAVESRIQKGITTYRQSDALIRVTDFSGKPMPNVKIHVTQHDSPFQFGANIFKLDDYESAEKNRNYEKAFVSIFNGATLPFYWRTLEPERGRLRFGEHSVPIARRPPPDRTVSFCEKHGLRMHGHTFVWNNRTWSLPDWLPDNPQEAAPLWEKRIREIGERYDSRIPRWDVVNEVVSDFKWQHGLTMPPDYAAKSFAWAEKYLPEDVRLDINETTDAWGEDIEGYTHLIERLLAAGRRVGGIGLQFHMFQDAQMQEVLAGKIHTPEQLFATLDRYGRFNLPIHISEITLTAPGNTAEGLEAQAQVARNFYRLWFSHPQTEGITWWNLPDGGAAPGEQKVYSGLLFEDMRPKPSYEVLQNLIRKEWRTTTEGVSDTEGYFRFRGFHGTYNIRTEFEGRTSGIESAITLMPEQSASQLICL